MRFATFVFLTIFLLQTSTAYAVLPAAGVVAGSLRTGGSLIVKGGTKGALITGGSAVGGFVSDTLKTWCKSNKKKCAEKIGDGLYDTIFGGDDDDDNNRCIVRFGDDKLTASGYVAYLSTQSGKDGDGVYKLEPTNDSLSVLNEHRESILKEVKRNGYRTSGQYNGYRNVEFPFYKSIKTEKGDVLAKRQFAVMVWVKCSNDDDREDYNEDLMDALKHKLDDEEFTQIINNYGDKNEFDIIINNCTGNNSCIEIDKDFADKVNNKDYDSDKMSKENCEVKNNKIVSCDKAKRKKDDDDDKDDKDKKDKDDKKKKDKDDDDKNGNKQPSTHRHDDDDDDDKILKCDSSEFHKKICDWIDWTQDKEEFKDDSEVDVDDLSKKLKLDDDKIKFNRACPSGQTVNISFGGITISHQISYDGLCQAFIKMKPFVVGMGFVVGAMIIGGRRV